MEEECRSSAIRRKEEIREQIWIILGSTNFQNRKELGKCNISEEKWN